MLSTIKKISLIIILISCVIFMNFLPQNNESVIFSLTYWNKDLVLIPIAIIKDSRLFSPPVIYRGRLNAECINFIEKYYKLGQTYYKANNGIPNEIVSINEELNHSKFYDQEFCYQPIYAKVFYLSNDSPSNCLITNSLILANNYSHKKIIGNKEKKFLLKTFIENFKNHSSNNFSYSLDESIETELNKKSRILISWISVKDNIDNKTKKYLTFFEKNKNGYSVVMKDSLYRYDQYNEIEFIEKSFIDVINLESDSFNELVFYYRDKNSFGYQIYKKIGDEWFVIYEINYGC